MSDGATRETAPNGDKSTENSTPLLPDRPASPAELEFITRLRARDEAAFADLLDRYHGPLFRLALVFVPSRAVAEEVVQETWLGVLDGLDTFEGRSTLKTWIFRILTNRAKTRGVRENRTIPFSGFEDTRDEGESAVDLTRFKTNGMWKLPPQPWQEEAADKGLMTQQAMFHLETALAGLPANQRAVVTLRDIDGLDSNEVCHVLGIAETNQRVLLHRARSRLRAVLEKYVDEK